MNKTWIFAAMALALGTSCSKDKGIDIDDSSKQEIVLGVGQSVSVQPSSRGNGAVGGLKDDNNWNGEQIYVYCISNGEYGAEKVTKTVKIDGELATAPNGTKDSETGVNKTTLTWNQTTPYYYNGKDVYDFYGVHIDDAVVEPADMKIDQADPADGFSVDITIDGSQDIMVAQPVKTDDITAAANAEVTAADVDRVYSAWSARRNVVPNLVFKHLLTRFNFQAQLGSTETEPAEDDQDIIEITKIEILNVYDNGTLNIIPVSGDQSLEPNGKAEPAVNFEVKSKSADGTLGEFTAVPVKTKSLSAVGEDVLLYPEASYTIKIYTEQDKNKNGNTDDEGEKWSEKFPIALSEGSFVAGSMYDINITVRGLQEITVQASLTPWENGGYIEVDSDNTGKKDDTGTVEP